MAIRATGENISFQAIDPILQCYNNSFAPATVRQWNSFPPHVRNEDDAIKFKSKLMQLYL